MSLAEEIKRVLTENPNILVEVLVSRPEIIYQALAKLTPWQELATKKDLEEMKKEMATKEDLEAIRREMATKQELEEIRKEMATKQELEEIKKVMATKEDLKGLATKQEFEEVRKEVGDVRKELEEAKRLMATKQELEEIKKVMATKDDLKGLATKEELETIKKVMATKQDIEELKRLIDLRLSALGARWGLVAEDVFRQGVADILSEAGWNASREVLLDKEGYVYGYPSPIEIDVVVKDGKVILVEITSWLKRESIAPLARKREFYERAKGVRVSEVIVITSYIDEVDVDRIIAAANSYGIKVIKPEEVRGRTGA